jgi:hypothetical protein
MFSGTYSAAIEFVVIAVVLLVGGAKPTFGATLVLGLFCGINLLLGAVRPLELIGDRESIVARFLVISGFCVVAVASALSLRQ